MVGRFEFSNSYIWFEFYNPPLQKDVTLLCDVSDLLEKSVYVEKYLNESKIMVVSLGF